MFQFQGGISDSDVEKIIRELQKRKHIKVNDNTDYSIEMLEYNLQNKDKLYTLWITIKCRFAEYKWLLILFQVLPLIIDLPDEINQKTYSQWLLDNGFKFEYKFDDDHLKFTFTNFPYYF